MHHYSQVPWPTSVRAWLLVVLVIALLVSQRGFAATAATLVRSPRSFEPPPLAFAARTCHGDLT